MAKLLKLRRGTTTQHSSFTGAEGEVTIDTTKDTAVVHDGAQAGGRALAREDMSNVSSASISGQLGTDSIATTKIAGGALPTDVTITNANIVANASIAGTKLENSGVTAGAYGSSSAIPIVTVDAQGLVTAASTTAIDSTTIANGSSSVSVANNGAITSNANHDFSAGIDVTGAITATGDITTTGKVLFANVYNNESDLPSASTYHGMFAHVHSTGLAYYAHAGNWIKLAKLDAPDFTGGVDVTGNITVTGTVDGRDVAADGTKLDGIESGATADQTNAEIKTAYEANSDTNAFTNAHQTKLGGIETGATADQTGAEIAAALGAQSIYTTGNIGRDANDHIAFTDNTQMDIYINNNNEFRFEADGDFHADGDIYAFSTTTASDENLKKDITIVTDAVSKVEAIKGVTFKWKKSDADSAGVIAQDVEKVLPEVVKTIQDPDGNPYKAVNYSGITSILIEAIKDLSARIKVLEAK